MALARPTPASRSPCSNQLNIAMAAVDLTMKHIIKRHPPWTLRELRKRAYYAQGGLQRYQTVINIYCSFALSWNLKRRRCLRRCASN
jgi:hypothetical protein